MSRYQLVRPTRLSLDTVAERSGLHPGPDPPSGRTGPAGLHQRRERAALVRAIHDGHLARVQRLRSELSLNYAAIGLVMDLLDRIHVLEAQVRSRQPWT